MKILVVDDHRLFGEILRYPLATLNGAVQVHVATDKEQAIRAMGNGFTPDLVLLELLMPAQGGQSLIKSIKHHNDSMPILLVSASQDIDDINLALDAGAHGFVSKCASSEEFLKAVSTVLGGERYIPMPLLPFVSRHPQAISPSKELGITNRQLEVLHLVSQGQTNRDIGESLGISENTVKVHLRELFRLLGVRNRTACVKVAREQGILPGQRLF